MQKLPTARDFRFGLAILLGLPNVGKSTLLNSLLGKNISITADKPQVTRNRILGIWNQPDFQCVLVDTPGLHTTAVSYQQKMVQVAKKSLSSGDLVLYLAEPSTDMPTWVVELLKHSQQPVLLLLNKIDRVKPEQILESIQRLNQQFAFTETLPISALHKTGLERLAELVKQHLPVGQAGYPSTVITDQSESYLITEFIRQQVFEYCHQELPYSTAVEVEQFVEQTKKCTVYVLLYVEKESQKKLLVGKDGTMIKRIRVTAEYKLKQFFGYPVKLRLHVKVLRDWKQKTQFQPY